MAATGYEFIVGLQDSPISDDTHSLYDPDMDYGEFDGSFEEKGWEIESPVPTPSPRPSLAPSPLTPPLHSPVASPRTSPAPIAPDHSPASASVPSTSHGAHVSSPRPQTPPSGTLSSSEASEPQSVCSDASAAPLNGPSSFDSVRATSSTAASSETTPATTPQSALPLSSAGPAAGHSEAMTVVGTESTHMPSSDGAPPVATATTKSTAAMGQSTSAPTAGTTHTDGEAASPESSANVTGGATPPAPQATNADVAALIGKHAGTSVVWIKPTVEATEPSGPTLRLDMDAMAIFPWFIKHGPKDARKHLRSYFLVAHRQYGLTSLELVVTFAHAFCGRVQKEAWNSFTPLVHFVQRLTVEDLLKSRAAVLAFKAAALEAWHRHGSRISHASVHKILIGETPRNNPEPTDTDMAQQAVAMEVESPATDTSVTSAEVSSSVPAPVPSTVDVQVGGCANKTGPAVAGPTGAGDLSIEHDQMDIEDASAHTEASAASTPSTGVMLAAPEATPTFIVATPVAQPARTPVGQQQPGSSHATATYARLTVASAITTGSSPGTASALLPRAAGVATQRSSSTSLGVNESAFQRVSHSQTAGKKRRRDDDDDDEHDASRAQRIADTKRARLVEFIQTTMGLTLTEEKRGDRVVPEERDNPFVGLLDGFIVKDLKPVAREKLKVRGTKLKSKAVMVRAAAVALEAKLRREYPKDMVDDMLDL